MTERWGNCRGCGGTGIVYRECPVLFRREKHDCPTCDGSGYSGTVEDLEHLENRFNESDEDNIPKWDLR